MQAQIDESLMSFADIICQQILNQTWPIGSIYLTLSTDYPGDVIGGTWIRCSKGLALVGVNEDDPDFTLGANNGVKNHVHSVPAHNHGIPDHNHSVPAHSHGLGTAGYAKIHHNNGKFWFHEISTASWTDSGTATATGANSSTPNTSGIDLGGSTNSSSALTSGNKTGFGTYNNYATNTGSTSNLQPYLTCYMWQRTA